jgi:hypothetical protein
MGGKIESLTVEQEARFPDFVEKWTQIALSTEPADRPRAEAAIGGMYRQAGLAAPKKIVWCGSPHSLLMMRDKKLMNSMGDCVTEAVRDHLIRLVNDGIRDNVSAGVRDLISANLSAKIRQQSQNISTNVLHCIMDSVRDGLLDGGDPGSLDGFARALSGQDLAARLATYRYHYEVLQQTAQTECLSGLWELAQSAGWAIPHQNVCWVSERYRVLERDEHGLLHSLSGPACAFPDGWAIHAVHSVRVPAFVVERPGDITVENIDEEENAEVRRVMIDRYRLDEEVNGMAAFLRDAGGKRVDCDEKFGTLWRREVPDDEPIVLLEVTNATPEPYGGFKHYWLRVPPTMTTAHEAAAWTFDQSPEKYAPLIET